VILSIPVEPVAAPVSTFVRGNLRIKARMEMLQNGQLYAIAAAAGCTMSKPEPDDGIDWQLTHTSAQHIIDRDVDLKIQLKSTSTVEADPASGFVAVSLSNDRFELMARRPVTIKRILVAMIVPPDIENWVTSSHQGLTVHHGAYWVSMAGMTPNAAAKSTTVRVPTSQIFDDAALCRIMQRIGAGGEP
jgi:hypothetical protein